MNASTEVKMRDTCLVTLSRCTLLISELGQTRPSAITTYANIPRFETLDCTLSQTNFPTLPPNPVFQNSLHRQFMLI